MSGEHLDISAEEYHADSAIGASMVEDFLESHRLYEGRYITHTIAPKEATPAMKLGTLVHMRILEPDRYRESLAEPYPDVAPDGKKWLRRKDSDHEKWWQEEVAKRDGKVALEQLEIDRIEAIAESVLSRKWARQLLGETGEPEYSIFWTDSETGLRCKCRIDWFDRLSLDLKTTADASPAAFARKSVQLGYHRKKSHYVDGLRELTGRTTLLHIAVSTEPPYACGAYEICDLDRNRKSLGERQRRRALNEIAECTRTGDWSDSWEHEIIALDLPGCAFSEDSYQL